MGVAAVRVRVRVHPVPPPGPWTARAACAAAWLDPVLRAVFTADAATDLDATARAVCAACPVRVDCDRHAISVRGGSITGIWGGRRRGDRTTTPARPTRGPGGGPVDSSAHARARTVSSQGR